MKFIFRILAAFIATLLLAYGIAFYINNRGTAPVSDAKLKQSYERSVVWLVSHRESILREGNPILWWMLGESARINGDVRVQQLVAEYRRNFDRSDPYSVWQAFFNPQKFRNGRFSESEYISLVEYQQYFLYALTCSDQLAKEPLIAAQNDPEFCWSGARTIRPACVTHQLMGYRMAQRNQCAVDNLDASIATLQKTIEKQLRYDPRVVDVYLQRALMLVDSGARDRLAPRWLERILDAQRQDGSWSDMQPLVPISGGRYFGFGGRGVTITTPASNFHTTAQGILLTTLLLHPPK